MDAEKTALADWFQAEGDRVFLPPSGVGVGYTGKVIAERLRNGAFRVEAAATVKQLFEREREGFLTR